MFEEHDAHIPTSGPNGPAQPPAANTQLFHNCISIKQSAASVLQCSRGRTEVQMTARAGPRHTCWRGTRYAMNT
jgi:hypothetical protein